MNCLNCGNHIEVTIGVNTRKCLLCGLETDVFEVEHGWGNYFTEMRYRIGFEDWIYVPTGCLAVFMESSL